MINLIIVLAIILAIALGYKTKINTGLLVFSLLFFQFLCSIILLLEMEH